MVDRAVVRVPLPSRVLAIYAERRVVQTRRVVAESVAGDRSGTRPNSRPVSYAGSGNPAKLPAGFPPPE